MLVDTVRSVGVWYYAFTAAWACVVVAWMVRRRVTRLGASILGVGAALNLLWEVSLWAVGGRGYDSPLWPPVHLILQAFTEFGPLFLGFVLGADWLGWARLDRWRAPGPPSTMERLVSAYGIIGIGVVALASAAAFLALTGPAARILVLRHVGLSFFLAEVAIAVGVLAWAWILRSRRALGWFACMGGLNVAVELGGVLLGFRSYGDASPVLSLAIGFGEGGAAAGLTWLLIERFETARA